MVSVTLTGLRLASSAADAGNAASAGQVVNANGHNAKDFWVRTLAEPDWGCDAIGRYQGHPGRPALDPAHDQLPFMQGHKAPA